MNINEAMAVKSYGLHLGPRALQCAALTFNADGLGLHGY